MNLRIMLLAFAALGISSRAVAGVILTAKGGESKHNEDSTIYFEGNKMRVERMGSDQESILIYLALDAVPAGSNSIVAPN